MDWTASAEKIMEAIEAEIILDWCEGCDRVFPRRLMGFNDIGLYRCHSCRFDETEVVLGHFVANGVDSGYIKSGAIT